MLAAVYTAPSFHLKSPNRLSHVEDGVPRCCMPQVDKFERLWNLENCQMVLMELHSDKRKYILRTQLKEDPPVPDAPPAVPTV